MSPLLHYKLKGLATLAVAFFVLFSELTGVVMASPLPPPVQPAPQPAQMGKGSEGKISPEVLKAMKSLPSGKMLTVIVTLNDQVNLSHMSAIPPGTNRAVRLKGVIEQLQSKARDSQRALKGLLNQQRAAGQVAQVEYFWIFNGLAVTATPNVIQELGLRPEVKSIEANATIQAPPPPTPSDLNALAIPELNLQKISAPELWAKGITGQGIVVANLDTGVDMASHPDLVAKWRGGTNSWFDPYDQNATPADLNGHGTATMGIMVGGEQGGKAFGVAPGAQWIAAKIFNNSGTGNAVKIHQAFQWLLNPDGDSNTDDAPHVVNNSWTWFPGCNYDFRPDVQVLRAAGILPIFAAGNDPSVNYSPANYPEAFAVGAVDNFDSFYISQYSDSTCDGTTYPEMVAPGVNIYTTDAYGIYGNFTGTSMAAPHVAGALALLLSASPQLTADEQETALLNGIVPLGSSSPNNTYGNGRLNIMASLQSLGELDLSVTQTASSGAIIVDWPLQYTISVANVGPADATGVTLTHTHSAGVDVGPIVSGQGDCTVAGTNDIICTLGEIISSSAVTVTVAYTPTTSGITLTNTSVVSTAEIDYNVQNNVTVTSAPILAEAPFKTFVPLILK